MSLINLVERYDTKDFEFDLKSKEYVGTYCSVWFKKDVNHPLLIVADEIIVQIENCGVINISISHGRINHR